MCRVLCVKKGWVLVRNDSVHWRDDVHREGNVMRKVSQKAVAVEDTTKHNTHTHHETPTKIDVNTHTVQCYRAKRDAGGWESITSDHTALRGRSGSSGPPHTTHTSKGSPAKPQGKRGPPRDTRLINRQINVRTDGVSAVAQID